MKEYPRTKFVKLSISNLYYLLIIMEIKFTIKLRRPYWL